MEAAFSEFSFGYAAIREAESSLTAVYRAKGAPVLPSLQMEEQLGYDVEIAMVEYALFLQFKRPTYVSRRHPNSPTWDHVGHRHYRIAIRTGEHQHQRLLELEQQLASRGRAGNVYYVAPRFHEQEDFDAAYLDGMVLDRSVIEPPSEFGDDGAIHHHVTDITTGVSQVLSEPRRPYKQVEWRQILQDTAARAERRERRSSQLNLSELEEMLLQNLPRSDRRIGRERDLDAPITRRIDRLATILGCGMTLFGSRRQ